MMHTGNADDDDDDEPVQGVQQKHQGDSRLHQVGGLHTNIFDCYTNILPAHKYFGLSKESTVTRL